ncbi:MAG: hypothetical protein ACRDY2_07865 [Acidimicrobiales bacterium]
MAYGAISAAAFAGQPSEALLVVLLGLGGFGLGTQFAALLAHLTNSVTDRYAPDISGVSTTALQIGGAIGVATLGSLYFALASHPGSEHARHAFAVVTAVLAAVSLLATALADGSIRRPDAKTAKTAKTDRRIRQPGSPRVPV